jgi:cysteine sulfinate desulfinase/cysteine desulfurase-like protein
MPSLGNPSSSHDRDQFAKVAVTDARRQVAALIGSALLFGAGTPLAKLLLHSVSP